MDPELLASLRRMLDAMPMLVSFVDADGIYRFANRAYEQWIGLPSQQIEGKSLREVLGDDAFAQVLPYMHRALAGETVSAEMTIPYRAGARTVELQYIPVPGPDGIPHGFYGLIADVSARKEVERQQQLERRTLMELGRIGAQLATELELGQLVQTATDEVTRMTGATFGAFFYNVSDQRGDSYTLYKISGVPRDTFARFPMPRKTELFAPTFEGKGTVRSGDITKDPRYGKSQPFRGMPPGHLPVRSYLSVPVIARSGKVLGGMFFGHPETEKFGEREEEIAVAIAVHAAVGIDNALLFRALAESEERFRQMANSIPQLAWTARPDGWIFWFNDRWYEYTGTTLEQMEGWGWHAVHDPNELPRVLRKLEEAFASGKPWEDTFPLRRHDGEMRWHLSRALPIRDPNGDIVLWFGTNTDVTEQRQAALEREQALEAEQAARAEAERLSRMKDEFLATLSHELRTPLNSIVAWGSLLRRGNLEPDTLQQALDTIDRSARAQAQMIDDLLDMNRIISGKVRLDVQRVDIADVVSAAVISVQPTAEAKKVRLEVAVDARAGVVLGDPHRLQQVVWNLLSNAIKFTPEGGEVVVSLRRLGDRIEICVRDTGIGIRADFLPHVFDRFNQADSSTTRKHGGLGLGLSIVKQLVEMHGGNVSVESLGEGLGATFRVELPRAARVESVEGVRPTDLREAAELEAPMLTGIKVLVVDNESEARQVLRRVLEEWEAEVTVAASADEGLNLLSHCRPDVIISDIGMPEKDGYQFIREVRGSEAADRRVPAIALTAFARSEDRRRALLAGYNAHIAKPMDPAELVTVVATLARRQ